MSASALRLPTQADVARAEERAARAATDAYVNTLRAELEKLGIRRLCDAAGGTQTTHQTTICDHEGWGCDLRVTFSFGEGRDT